MHKQNYIRWSVCLGVCLLLVALGKPLVRALTSREAVELVLFLEK